MLGPVLACVVGMRLAPFFPAVAHHLGILRVALLLLPVIIPPALPLARGLAANSLLATVDRWMKRLLAIRTVLG